MKGLNHILKITLTVLISIGSVAQRPLSDTSKLFSLVDKGQSIYLEYPDSAKEFWEEGLDLCEELLHQSMADDVQNSLLVTKSDLYFNLSQIYREEGDISATITHLERALTIDKKLDNKSNMSSTYNDLGIIYNDIGLFEKALEYYLLSLKMDRELGNRQGESASLINLGYLHAKLKHYDEAKNYFHESIAIGKELNDTLGLVRALNNMGAVCYEEGQLDSAVIYTDQSLEFANYIHNKSSIANSLARLGLIANVRQQYDSAYKYFMKALTLREEMNEVGGILSSYFDLANYFNQKEQLSKAIGFAEKAHALAQTTQYPEYLNKSTLLLSELYAKKGDYRQAYLYQSKHIQLETSLRNKEHSKLLFKRQYEEQYEQARTQDSLINLEKEARREAEANRMRLESAQLKQRQAENQKRTTLYIISALSIVVVLSVVVILLVRHNRVQKKSKLLIQKQKDEVESQKLQIEQQHHQLEETHKAISDSIEYAERLQQAILPAEEEMNELFSNHFIIYKPKDVVSGDFYWSYTRDSSTFFAVGDCTGHGVPGALVSVVCHNALSRAVEEFRISEPNLILDKTRDLVVEKFTHGGQALQDGMDISLIRLEVSDGVTHLEYSGANNPLWIIRSSSPEQIEDVRPDKQPIGRYLHTRSFNKKSFKLHSGDRIYLFSDGFADQFGGPNGKKLKASNVKNLLLEVTDSDINVQGVFLKKKFQEWKADYEQLDDVCFIGIQL